jgi:predicted lipoprotein with Yx(FWY)xxD motif
LHHEPYSSQGVRVFSCGPAGCRIAAFRLCFRRRRLSGSPGHGGNDGAGRDQCRGLEPCGESSLGTIVVDGKGMSLYYFTKDTKDTKVSACTGGCLEAWPIATTTNDTPVVEGVTGEVGTIDSPDGKKHLTLNGMPLYYWAKDTKPGDVTGQGVNDVWYVVTPAGEMIK